MWILGKYVLPPLFPFILAYLMLAVVDPLGPALSRLYSRVGRGWALVLAAGALALPGLLVLRLGLELALLGREAPRLLSRAQDILGQIWHRYQVLIQGLHPAVREALDTAGGGGYGLASEFLERAMDGLDQLLLHQLPGMGLFLGVTVMAFVLMACDREGLGRMLRGLLGAVSATSGSSSPYHRAVTFLVTVLRVELALDVVIALILGLGLAALGVPYPALIALLAAILGLMPVVGPVTLLVPWALIELVAGSGMMCAALLFLSGLVLAVRIYVQSRTILRQAGLSPLQGLCALYVGWRLLGLSGILIAPAATLIWRGRHLS